MPTTYIIFITENDIFKGGQAIYRVTKTLSGINEPFEDRQHIWYVNASYTGEGPLGELMHDFLCSNPDDMYTEMLADKARYLKSDPEEVEIMCEVMEELREQSVQRWIDQNRVENIKTIIK